MILTEETFVWGIILESEYSYFFMKLEEKVESFLHVTD